MYFCRNNTLWWRLDLPAQQTLTGLLFNLLNAAALNHSCVCLAWRGF